MEYEQTLRNIVKIALQRAGFAVAEAEEVDEAMRVWEVNNGQFALVITDVALRDGGQW